LKSAQKYDVIVVGVGSMGASTCYNLAKRGAKVLGLEQFNIVHEKGSHAGQTRILRKAYFEHPDYVQLLDTTYKLWAALEQKTGEKLIYKTGLFYAGPKQHELLEGVKLSAKKYNIPLKTLTEKECSEQFPTFKFNENYEYLFEANAGYLEPEKIIRIYSELAKREGATLLENQLVESWHDINNRITVKTKNDTFFADKIIFTAGGFTQKLLPFRTHKLVSRRQITCWFEPKETSLFENENFPCFIYATSEVPGSFYGFPLVLAGQNLNKKGVKVGYHFPGEAIDPYTLNQFSNEKDAELIKKFMQNFIPDGYKSSFTTKACIYTYSEDGHFIIENHKTHKNVCLACGFSGHGFKFAPLVGEILADLSLNGKTNHSIGFLSSDRFK
jgi:sarcosine oxidase